MSTDDINFDQETGGVICKRRARAVVWDYFEKITGNDGLPKTKCIKCNTTYTSSPRSGTSTMRRHLRKCNPQPLTQLSATEANTRTITTRSSDDLLNVEAREAKKFKSVMENSLQIKTDRELREFIWRNKRNIGLLEEKLPDKAVAIKETLKCYEDELDRRAKIPLHKEKNPVPGTSSVAVKIEVDDQLVTQNGNFGENMAVDWSAMEDEITGTDADVNQKSSPQFDTEKVVIKVEVDDQSVPGNENSDGNIAEEESAGRLQIVAINGVENEISTSPEDVCSELRKVSSVLSMLTSPNNSYTPRDNPLDEEAEEAKKTLNELLKKDFETIVGSADEQTVKSAVQILIGNLDKLPRFQGRVVESLYSEFEPACKNWITWHKCIQTNLAFEAQQGDNLGILQEWQEKDAEIESRIAEVDADIARLKSELHEKEASREKLMKRKSDLFNQSSAISMDEAKKLLQVMVGAKLQSDVAIDNLKDLANKWEKIRMNFQQQ